MADEALVVNNLMLFHIPKVTIYRIGTLKPTAPTIIDFMLKFSNPNMTRA